MKRAFITGITGQDGSYLAEFLLTKGYEVHGMIRRASTFNTGRVEHILLDPNQTNFTLHYGDLSDIGLLSGLLFDIKPDEIYHLGAQSHVRISFDLPEYTGNITGLGTTRILEVIRKQKLNTKFYQASSSELFGAAVPPQNENTPFLPQSPYAAAKLYAYWMTVNYRLGYNLFACNGILFNHESPRRGETFVTRKITMAIANILAGKQKVLYLGNLDAIRDWGYAPEYVEVMWMMLQQPEPFDMVIGTSESHSVRDFIVTAFKYAGVEIEWKGEHTNEVGIISKLENNLQNDLKVGDEIVKINPRYYRATEVNYLLADTQKAKNILNWEPKIKFNELVKIMVDYDLLNLAINPKGEGIELLKSKNLHWTNHNIIKYQ